jgi:ribosomal protein L19E
MTIGTVRRLAADIMRVGRNKVKISMEGNEVEGALTRSDVKGLIEKGIITKAKPKGRASTAKKTRKGRGSRKGKAFDKKAKWMLKVRAQRRVFRMLVEQGVIGKESKRSLYGKIKSGIFRSKRAFLTYLKENELVPKDFELPKAEHKPKPKKVKAKKEKKAEKPKEEGEKS